MMVCAASSASMTKSTRARRGDPSEREEETNERTNLCNRGGNKQQLVMRRTDRGQCHADEKEEEADGGRDHGEGWLGIDVCGLEKQLE